MQLIGSSVIHLKSVNSTNDFASSLVKNGNVSEGTVVVSDFQNSGRGRGSNQWASAKNKNLLFSIVLFPDFLEVQQQFYLSKAVALGIADFLANYSFDVSIKWPNDIYIGDKKICGALIEQTISGQTIDSSIVGVGLNINQERFSKKILNPVSLKKITGLSYDLNECLDTLLVNIDFRYQQLKRKKFSEIDEKYNSYLYKYGELVKFKSGKNILLATIQGVNEFGQIVLVSAEKKEMHFNMDEIEFIFK